MSLKAAGLQLFHLITPLPVITTHYLRHFSAFCLRGSYEAENEENPATPLRCFLLQNVVACGLGPSNLLSS